MRGGVMTRSELVKKIEVVKSDYLKIKWCRNKEYRSRQSELPAISQELKRLKNALNHIDNEYDYNV